MKKDLKQIFDAFYQPLCNYANAIIRDQHFAEDIVQSIFIQLWESDKITNLDNPEPYLMRCVKYKCLDHLKKPANKKVVLGTSLPEIASSDASDLGEEDVVPLLHFFASQLPPKMQRIFLMSRNQNMTYKEIAEELGISIKTVENQMGTALKKLRVLLKKHHFLTYSFILSQL